MLLSHFICQSDHMCLIMLLHNEGCKDQLQKVPHFYHYTYMKLLFRHDTHIQIKKTSELALQPTKL